MRQSFYQYLMTQRHPGSHDPIAQFAQNAFLDHDFPKLSEDYDELSDYLELSGDYVLEMSVFDEAFQNYLSQMGNV
ncbi:MULTISPECIES: YozE family protein [Holzapfeliella]